MSKKKIVGVKFDGSNEINYYDTKNLWVHENLPVIVKHKENLDYGFIKKIEHTEDNIGLPKIIRVANNFDQHKYNINKNFERYAMDICKQEIKNLDLKIKLITAHLTFDGYKIIFYFKSEQRIEFRVLIRELIHKFKIKVELKYMGARDEAKNIPSIGICGRPLCCNKFLDRFDNISIQMAKDQNISLHPFKISGNCGRLLCCLKYEQDMYTEVNKKIPPIGSIVQTPNGPGKVVMVNILNQTARILFHSDIQGDIQTKNYPLDKIKILDSNQQN